MDSGAAEASARFGANMRSAREATGLSQEKFAQQAGVHRTYIGSLERGKHSPSLWTIVRIARELGVPAQSLLDGIE